MAPKKKGKKEPEVLEPDHDPSWERSVQSGVWERAVTALPGAPLWAPAPRTSDMLQPQAGQRCAREQAAPQRMGEAPCSMLCALSAAGPNPLPRARRSCPGRLRATDSNAWPTWGALRERVLASCREVRCSVRQRL